MKKLILVIFIITTALQSAEIIPVWNKESGAGDIQDMELLKGGDQFIILAGEGPEAQIQIRNTEDGELVSSFTAPISTGSKLQITPDSSRILVVNGSYAQLRNLDSEYSIQTTYHIESDSIKLIFNNLAIDPIRPIAYLAAYGGQYINGKYQSASKILAYNYETGEHIKDLTGLGEYEFQVMDVSDDGKYLATINEGKAYLKVWDLETMELIRNVQLYDDKLPNTDWWCESKDIQFSKLNSDVVYYSGNFPWSGVADTEPSPTNGLRKYIISININSMNIQEKTLSGKFILFDNEERSLVYTYGTMFFYNYKEKFQEFYNKPPQNIYVGGKTIYSEKSNYFIGFAGDNICKFLYDRQTSINSDIEKELRVSPNPTSSIVNLSLDCSDEKTSYTITNQSGQVVGGNTIPMSSNSLQIDFSPFLSGVYFLTIRCGSELKTYKVVREG
jgi:hypothetical protein